MFWIILLLTGFNPRARTGRDFIIDLLLLSHICFNPRARTGRDGIPGSVGPSGGPFQSTRPHGARHRYQHPGPNPSVVSIHAPARGATSSASFGSLIRTGFNPRARTGRDGKTRQIGGKPPVSIHAPARGATALGAHPDDALAVSIHAPARGATDCRSGLVTTKKSFNPRARTGRDPKIEAGQ